MPRDDRPPFRKSSKFSKPPQKKFGRGGFRKGGPKRTGGDDDVTPEGVRLQKVMASAGVGSRRHCEELIAAGRVQIAGTTARLGDRVPEGAKVTVDGEELRVSSRPVYYLVNKPDGVVSTNYDQSGRTRVIDLVPQDDREHLFTVGRLDMSSEGLILVTNDGELANRLTHPKFGVEKTYLALVAGRPESAVYQKLRQGVHLAEGVARCVSVFVKKELPQSTLLEIVLNEGKNREIRRILAKVGHKVLTLKRIGLGELTMKGLRVGEFRPLSPHELRLLQESTGKRRRPQTQARPVDEAELLAAAKPAVADGDEPTDNAPPREGRGDRSQGRREDRGDGRGGDRRPPRAGGKFGREGRPPREGQAGREGRPALAQALGSASRVRSARCLAAEPTRCRKRGAKVVVRRAASGSAIGARKDVSAVAESLKVRGSSAVQGEAGVRRSPKTVRRGSPKTPNSATTAATKGSRSANIRKCRNPAARRSCAVRKGAAVRSFAASDDRRRSFPSGRNATSPRNHRISATI
ncbi:MAG: pseudouridine synthase [Pirellulales bacterium]